MPSKYVVRNFTKDSYYHVYNQGVEEREIFQDEDDYRLFRYYLFIYLRPLEEVLDKYPDLPTRLASKNLSEEVELLAYTLMPNHFHLLLKQGTKYGVSKLMKQVTNAYTLHFNEKYDRIGGLMQGRYKAVEVKEDDPFIHLVRYIHLNPVISDLTGDLRSYPWTSYGDYLGDSSKLPCSKDKVLSYFPSVGAFRGFHEDQEDYAKGLGRVEHLAIDFKPLEKGFNP